MSDWSVEIDFLARKLGMGAANTVRAIRSAMDADPFEILTYRGYGNGVKAHVYGRVVERSGVTPSNPKDSVLTNLLNTYRRAESDPLRRAEVKVEFGGSSTTMSTDDEGFFGGWVSSEKPEKVDEWHTYATELTSHLPSQADGVTAKGEILVPPESATFGVISDIDDTVIQSRVSNFLQAARTVMLGNARTRLPFPGVGALYRAFRDGVSGDDKNPVFYVSSSPWNIYDVIAEFMELQKIPRGPLMLRDWDISLGALSSARHYEHKTVAIRNVMQLYPQMQFVLIGDTSQHDPEIYARIVAEFPERVRAIYIRDVSHNPLRTASIEKLAGEVREAKCSLTLIADSIHAAKDAADQGLISPDALPEVNEEENQL